MEGNYSVLALTKSDSIPKNVIKGKLRTYFRIL